MLTPFHIAHHIITEQQRAGRTVDKMQLQKLLYLAQGAHLELWGEPLFDGDRDPFLAYRNGPVIRSVEQEYRPAAEDREPLPEPETLRPIPREAWATVHLVLEMFGEWDAPQLERLTKRAGTPWREVRGDLSPGEDSNREIDVALIQSWFRRNGLDPEQRKLTRQEKEALDRLASGDEEALVDLIR